MMLKVKTNKRIPFSCATTHSNKLKLPTNWNSNKVMHNYTFVIILNSKLDKWVGSSLWRTPLAADSCSVGDGCLVFKRLRIDCIASDSWTECEDEEHSNDKCSTIVANKNLEFLFGIMFLDFLFLVIWVSWKCVRNMFDRCEFQLR